MTEMKKVDCRGLSCPQPVLDTKAALEQSSAPLVVIVDNEASCSNVSRFAQSQGARVTVERHGGDYHLTIEPGQHAPSAEPPPITCSVAPGRNTVIYVSSEFMGRGDDKLGAVLMAAFLDTLSHFNDLLSHAIFVNGGVRLAVEGSPVLEQIRQIEQLGAEVLVCGTCLNHFGIKDKLVVGCVSNMYSIIETLSRATRIIQP